MAVVNTSYGQNSVLKDSSSLIKNIKLFSSGASVYRTTSELDLKKGLTHVRISDISSSILEGSIKVYPEKDLQVLSGSVSIDSTGYRNDPGYHMIRDSLKAVNDSLREVNKDIDRLHKLLAILHDNREIRVSDRSIYVDDLDELLGYYDRKLIYYARRSDSLTRHRNSLIRNKAKLITAKRKTVTTLGYPKASVLLLLRSQIDMKTRLHISYSVQDAGWTPRYSVNALPDQREVNIVGWAEVYQHTGCDWNNVPVEFMTGSVNDLSIAEGASGSMYSDSSSRSRITRIASTAVPVTIKDGSRSELTYLFEENRKGEVINFCYPSRQERVYVNVSGTGLIGSYYPKGDAAFSINNNYLRTLSIQKEPYEDSVSYSLGINDDFNVRRVLDKDKFRKALFGSTVKQEVLYTLYLTNQSAKEAEILIYDQLPKQEKSAIEVNYSLPRGAVVNENKGFFQLRSRVEPGETIEIEYGYKLSYPKGLEINNYQELNH